MPFETQHIDETYCTSCSRDNYFDITRVHLHVFQLLCRQRMIESGHSKLWLFTCEMNHLAS